MTYGICRICGLLITEADHEVSHTDIEDPLAEVHEECCDLDSCREGGNE